MVANEAEGRAEALRRIAACRSAQAEELRSWRAAAHGARRRARWRRCASSAGCDGCSSDRAPRPAKSRNSRSQTKRKNPKRVQRARRAARRSIRRAARDLSGLISRSMSCAICRPRQQSSSTSPASTCPTTASGPPGRRRSPASATSPASTCRTTASGPPGRRRSPASSTSPASTCPVQRHRGRRGAGARRPPQPHQPRPGGTASGPPGAGARRPPQPHQLDLSNGIGAAGAQALAGLRNLTSLDLSGQRHRGRRGAGARRPPQPHQPRPVAQRHRGRRGAGARRPPSTSPASTCRERHRGRRGAGARRPPSTSPASTCPTTASGPPGRRRSPASSTSPASTSGTTTSGTSRPTRFIAQPEERSICRVPPQSSRAGILDAAVTARGHPSRRQPAGGAGRNPVEAQQRQLPAPAARPSCGSHRRRRCRWRRQAHDLGQRAGRQDANLPAVARRELR